jgi:hypothetical protein
MVVKGDYLIFFPGTCTQEETNSEMASQYRRIYASKKCKWTMAEKGDNSDVEDDFADEPDAKRSFNIGQTIDLESEDLADVLTDCQGKPSQRKLSLVLLHQRKCSRRNIGRCGQYILLL